MNYLFRFINWILRIFESSYWYVKRKVLFDSFGQCGRNVHIGRNWAIPFPENICLGNDISLGTGVRLAASNSRIILKDHVLFGPNVSIHGGNHRIDIPGRTIKSVTTCEKRPGIDDADVVIGEDVWVGERAQIMMGVQIGRGCVIGANSTITKDTEPYGIYVGVNRLIGYRFSKEQIIEHEKALGLS